MAQPNILFYKSTSAPDASTHGIGTLWFDKTNRVLKVRIGITGTISDWEQYAGKIDDIRLLTAEEVINTQTYGAGTLVITKANGDVIGIDLTDIASAGQVAQALANLDAKITAVDTAYKAADTAMNTRISTLESQITGLSGTLHFLGVLGSGGFDELPDEPAVGDFYINSKGEEYIYDGSDWEKIGDTSTEIAAIESLRADVATNKTDIAGLKTSTANNTQAISKEAEDRAAADLTLQTNINTENQRAEAAEAALDTRITACETALTWSGFDD